MAKGRVHIGTSGWIYDHWKGRFYPEELRNGEQLPWYAERFDAVEINGSFYGMQVPRSFATWHDAVPPDTLFAVKGPRYLTHMLKLNGPEAPLANFFASGVLALGEKLGPILWQFPPNFGFHPESSRPSSSSCRRPARTHRDSPAATTTGCGPRPISTRVASATSATAWRSGTRASAHPISSRSFANMASRWSAPTPSTGRC